MKIITIIFLISIITLNALAQLKLPSAISDHMVLQQKADIPIWGWANPKATVTVSFMGQTKSVTADAEGNWEIKLSPVNATSKPQKMLIKSGDSTILLNDILVGEVWICSGQSNMEFPIEALKNGVKRIEKANDSRLRFLAVNKFNFKPYECDDCSAKWLKWSPENAGKRTAVGYFFGSELRKKLKVPIGLIEVYFGGTSIGCWTSADIYKKWPNAGEQLDRLAKYKNNKKYRRLRKLEKKEWFKKLKKFDKGFLNNWMSKDISLTGWEKVENPASWESINLKDFKGTVWFRKEINIPIEWKNKKLIVELGMINQYDIVWMNGRNIGIMQAPFLNWVQRHYEVEGTDYEPGKNTIVVCDYNQDLIGGMTGPKENMKIYPDGQPEKAISLAGEWYYKKGYEGNRLPVAPTPFSIGYYTLSVLYNSMIVPVTPYGIRGAIWYQGEANQLNPYDYKEMMKDMIENWREDWGQGDFPFYYVQIAPYNYSNSVNSALLREAQLSAMDITNTGMAVTMDIGNPNDIHPKNKKDVGHRLALWALAKDYGFKDIVYSGPVYRNMKISDNKIILSFDYDIGLKSRDGKSLTDFKIAGNDKKFYPATAKIKNNKVIVYSDKVKNPVAVKYGWSDTSKPNLCNKANLPASSFRTDNWK